MSFVSSLVAPAGQDAAPPAPAALTFPVVGIEAGQRSLPLDEERNQTIKNICDRFLAVVAILLASPLMAMVAILVRITSRGPVIHRRRVAGRYGIEFDAFKFRTMVLDADRVLAADPALQRAFEVNHKLERDPRVTPIGKFLRKLSLDELPQFFNVLMGQMSVVGPRMLSPGEVGRYGVHVPTLLSVKPGLTGLWQVSGRQRTTYERRIQLDVEYVETWTLWKDFWILLKTPIEVFKGTGAF